MDITLPHFPSLFLSRTKRWAFFNTMINTITDELDTYREKRVSESSGILSYLILPPFCRSLRRSECLQCPPCYSWRLVRTQQRSRGWRRPTWGMLLLCAASWPSWRLRWVSAGVVSNCNYCPISFPSLQLSYWFVSGIILPICGSSSAWNSVFPSFMGLFYQSVAPLQLEILSSLPLSSLGKRYLSRRDRGHRI